MDDPKLISSATGLIGDILQSVANHGLEGLLGIFILYKHWFEPKKEAKEEERKKAAGEWIEWSDVKQVKEELTELKATLNNHLVKEQEEDIKMKAMEKDIQYQGAEITETKGDVKDIFRILGEIKNLIIERKA